ncbi:hypothetical protein OH76DRAFT_1411258 [Lentinus brumalis]|uniref:Uncharacterized protein n=1 Tax=Lentinus brumalis TaxID=2498619 RepID=A0A371CQ79_9APHY|nr:hypothetical protein OH76DRAFT_1411258 [Polyporus brumalis]
MSPETCKERFNLRLSDCDCDAWLDVDPGKIRRTGAGGGLEVKASVRYWSDTELLTSPRFSWLLLCLLLLIRHIIVYG